MIHSLSMWDQLTLAVGRSIYQKGVEALTSEALSEAEMLEVLPALDVLTEPQDPPRVFFAYHLHDPAGAIEPPWPRFRKPVLKALRGYGREVKAQLITLDVDLKDQPDLADCPRTEDKKVRWGPEAEAWQLRRLDPGREALRRLGVPEALRYRTTHGLRLVYVVEHQLVAEDHERATAAVIGAWERAGVSVDHKCRDWTRAFFGPKPGALVERQAELSAVRLAALSELPQVADLESAVADPPAERRAVAEDDARVAALRDSMRSANNSEHLFTDVPLPMGRRDSTLYSLAASGVNRARKVGAGPEHVMAVLLPVLGRIEAAPGEDWEAKLWEKISRLWTRGFVEADMAPDKVIQDATRRATFELQARQNVDAVAALAARVAEWCPDPQLRSIDPGQVRAALLGRVLFYHGGEFYVMRPETGDYARQPVEFPTYHPSFARMLDLLAVDPAESAAWQGKRKFVENFAKLHGEVDVKKIVYGFRGVRIERTVMIVGAIELSLPEPAFSQDVADWLHQLDQTGYVTAWLAAALAVDQGRVPCLYLHGHTGTGKTLLAHALASCFAGGFEMPVDGGAMVRDFNSQLAKSPIVLFDEGLAKNTARHFRSLVGGRGSEVREKHEKAQTKMEIPHRVIVAANNEESIIRCLEEHSTADDRKAVMRRISMVHTTRAARDVLVKMDVERWLPKDKPWEGVLPRHLSWLYERREQVLAPFRDPAEMHFLLPVLHQEEVAERLHLQRTAQTFHDQLLPLLVGLETIAANTEMPGARSGWDFIMFTDAGNCYVQVGAWRLTSLVPGSRSEVRKDITIASMLRQLNGGQKPPKLLGRLGHTPLSGKEVDARVPWTMITPTILTAIGGQELPEFWALLAEHAPDLIPPEVTSGEA